MDIKSVFSSGFATKGKGDGFVVIFLMTENIKEAPIIIQKILDDLLRENISIHMYFAFSIDGSNIDIEKIDIHYISSGKIIIKPEQIFDVILRKKIKEDELNFYVQTKEDFYVAKWYKKGEKKFREDAHIPFKLTKKIKNIRFISFQSH